jgi:ubiquinone/menaquinone biosynthesis C-methylase UbiE
MDLEAYKQSQAGRFFGGEVKEVQGRLKHAYKFFGPYTDKTLSVLDIGARDGWMVEYLKRKHYYEVIGLEITEAAQQYARSRGRRVILGDAHDLSIFPDNKFGTVLITHCLEHCHTPQKVVDEVCRVFQKGGIFYVEVPLETEAARDMAHFCNFLSIEDVAKLLGPRFELLQHRIVLGDKTNPDIKHLQSIFRKM